MRYGRQGTLLFLLVCWARAFLASFFAEIGNFFGNFFAEIGNERRVVDIARGGVFCGFVSSSKKDD